MEKNSLRNEKGITLITLVVTIIVLLILAGITVTGISGNNGIVEKTADARNSAEVKSEMKLVEVASNSARGKNRYGNISKESLQKELDISAGKDKTEVTEELDENDRVGYRITFLDSKRYYFVYNEGEDAEIIFIGVVGRDTNNAIIHAIPRRGQVVVGTSEKVKILLRTFSNIENNNIDLSYGWSNSSYKEPESYTEVTVNGSGNDKTSTANYPDVIGNYYLYVKAKINDVEQISKVFGEYEVVSENSTIVASRYTVTYLRGANVLKIGANVEDTTGKVTLPSITPESGFEAAGWFDKEGVYRGKPGDTITIDRNLELTAEALDSKAPTVRIAREKYNTFSWEAKDKGKITGYQITTSQTAPSADDSGWIRDGKTSDTYEISDATTYYVYAIDDDENVGRASIDAYLVSKIQGAGTTLTAKPDGENGEDFTGEIPVLEGTPIYVAATANEGYSTVILKSGSKRLNENGDNIIVHSPTTIESSARKDDKDAPTVIIAKVNCHTFRWEATDDGEIIGYQILLNPTATPSTDGWRTDGILTEGTYNEASTEGTYYVYVKDSEGNIGSKSISAYTVMKNQGENTTLTVMADSPNESTGTPLNANTAVLKDTELWIKLKTETGYTGTLKVDRTVQNSNETTITVDSNKIIESSAKENTYTIAFNSNGGSGEMQNMTGIKYTQSVQLTENDFVKEGYTFKEWNTKQDGSGTKYEDKASVSKLTSTKDGTVTLYAQWSTNKYTIVFDKNVDNEDEVTGTMNDLSMNYGEEKNLPENTYTRKGYTFSKWNTEANGSGTSYNNKAPVSNLTDVDNETVSLYAQWDPLRSVFKTGQEVNSKMKQLAGNSSVTYSTQDTNITEVKRATSIASQYKIDNNIVSTADSNTPIYMWYDNGTIYYYTEDIDPETNEDASYMFSNLKNSTKIDVSTIYTGNTTNMSYMFNDCQGLTSLDVSGFDTSKVTDMKSMFQNSEKLTNLDLSEFDTAKVVDMSSMFNGCQKLTSLDVGGFNTSEVTNMSLMFGNCQELSSIDVSGFNTSNTTNMRGMFDSCKILSDLDVSGFETSKVTDMNSMFGGCEALTSIEISTFNTSSVTDMGKMFNSCKALESIDVSGFDTAKVTDMSFMFCLCQNLTDIDVVNFNTSNVTNMSNMFNECDKITQLNIRNFNTAKVTDTENMFRKCTNLKTIYASNSWTTNAVTKSSNMFEGDTVLVGGFGTTFDSSKIDKEYARIDQGTTLHGYFTDVTLYFVEFEANGGTGTMTRQEMHYGTSSNLKANTFTRTGHSFAGWKDEEGNSYTNSQSVLNLEDGYAKTKKLYAQWTANKYTVTYNGNGGTASPTSKQVTYGEPYGELATATRTGRKLLGWTKSYQELEYIESDGTQYINTGYNPKPTTGIEVTYQYTDLTQQQCLYGVHGSAELTNSLTCVYYINSESKFTYSFKNKEISGINTNVAADTKKHTFKINVYNNGKWSIDNGAETALSGTKTNNALRPLFIMATNYYDNSVICKSKVKIYAFKIYEGSTLVRNYVPCLYQGKLGLYDKVNNQFYGNAGTGEFETGEIDYVTEDTTVTEASNHTLYANWSSSKPVVTITRVDYNTFRWTASDDGSITGYQILTDSSTLGTWTTTGTLTSGTKDTVTTAPHTYTVCVKDDDGNITKQSISSYNVTTKKGTGTTINVKEGSNLITSISSTLSLLRGTPLTATASSNAGYTPTLKIGGTEKTGSGTTVSSSITINAATTIESAATANKYKIVFNKNNANATGTMADMSMTYGVAKNLTANSFVVSSKGVTSRQIFNGWNTKQDGSGTSYNDAQSVSNLTATNNGTVTLYAKWIDANYGVDITSSKYRYATTLSSAVSQSAASGSVITLLHNYTDSSDVTCNKTVSFKTGGKTLTRGAGQPIKVTGGTFTVADSGTITSNDTSGLSSVFVINGGKFVVSGNTAFTTFGTIINAINANSEIVISSGKFNSTDDQTIFFTHHKSATITGAYVYTRCYNKSAIYIGKEDTGTVTVNGSSKIGNAGTSHSSGTATSQSAIHYEGTGTLTIAGTSRIYAGKYASGACVGLAGNAKKVVFSGSSKLYNASDRDNARHGVYSLKSNATLSFAWDKNTDYTDGRSAGAVYTRGTHAVYFNESNSGTISISRGTFVSCQEKMFRNNGASLTAANRIGKKNTGTFTYYYMTAYNDSATGKTTRSPYYICYVKKN